MERKTRVIMFRESVTEEVREPSPPQTAAEIRESNRTSLATLILMIKGQGEKIGLNITDEEIAWKLRVSIPQLQAYLNGNKNTPGRLPGALLSAYNDLLDIVRKKENASSLKQSVVWIRNCGLAKGLNIAVGEMAQSISIPEEQLYGYLNDDFDSPDGLAFKLESAYEQLIEGIRRVEIKEGLDTIKQRP